MAEREELKSMALKIVAIVAPEDAFIVEDNFDGLVDDWHRAVAQDEGRFLGGAEVAAFAAAVVPFLLTFLGDVAKDVVKDLAKKGAAASLEKLLRRQSGADETQRLRTELDVAIAKSKVSQDQKKVLRQGFDDLFDKLK